MEEEDVSEDEVEDDEVEDDDVKGEENDDVGNEDVEGEDRSQDLGPHFVRACNRNALQHFTKATLYRKNAGPRVSTLIRHPPLQLP